MKGPLFDCFFPLMLSKDGLWINLMSIMLFRKVIFIWNFHLDSLVKGTLIFVNYIDLFMRLNMFLINSPDFPPFSFIEVFDNLFETIVFLDIFMIKLIYIYIYIFSLVSDIIISRNNIMLLFLSLKISLLNLSPLKFLALLHIFYLLMFLIQNKEFFYVNKNIILIFYLFLVWLVPDHLISIHNSIFIYD